MCKESKYKSAIDISIPADAYSDYVLLGNADGSYTVIGSAGVGTTSEREAALPQKGQKD